MNNQKKIFVISGPSGTGKSTLINMLLKEFGGIVTNVISCTTRNRREIEIDGVDYHFINNDKFLEMIEDGQFIEYVKCFGNYYGTSIPAIKKALEKCNSCIMDIEWEGAYKVLQSDLIDGAKRTGILILPPSISSLKQRLMNRRSETDDTLRVRIDDSFKASKIANYDYVIINNNIDNAYQDLKSIFLTSVK